MADSVSFTVMVTDGEITRLTLIGCDGDGVALYLANHQLRNYGVSKTIPLDTFCKVLKIQLNAMFNQDAFNENSNIGNGAMIGCLFTTNPDGFITDVTGSLDDIILLGALINGTYGVSTPIAAKNEDTLKAQCIDYLNTPLNDVLAKTPHNETIEILNGLHAQFIDVLPLIAAIGKPYFDSMYRMSNTVIGLTSTNKIVQVKLTSKFHDKYDHLPIDTVIERAMKLQLIHIDIGSPSQAMDIKETKRVVETTTTSTKYTLKITPPPQAVVTVFILIIALMAFAFFGDIN